MPRTDKLLFRWVGKGIERDSTHLRGVITREQRQQYLKHLSDALDPQKGLFAAKLNEEYLGKKIANGSGNRNSVWQFKSELPGLCFTEIDLGDCADHWKKFGRLAFGFTKQFILEQGGSSMQYCLGTKDCDSVHDLACVSNYLRQVASGAQKADVDATAAFQRLCHFYKRVRPVVPDRKASPTQKTPDLGDNKKNKYRPEPTREATRAKRASFGRLNPMPYLEEHEWRLVYNENHPRWRGISGKNSPDNAWFHIKTGEELQMVILPDNRSLQLVQQSDYFCERLFKFPKKPVQVLSLEVIART